MDIYEGMDNVIRQINRYNIREFGRLRLVGTDELNIIQGIREVRTVYERSEREMRKRLRKACEDILLLYLMLCGYDEDEALRMASGEISLEWLLEKEKEIDPVTRYRFEEETNRKIARLAESLTIPDGRETEIDRALKLWTRQIGWFGIFAVDAAAMTAMRMAEVEKVQWHTKIDGRQCEDCEELDGQIFDIDKVPNKPHHGCRCWLTPAR